MRGPFGAPARPVAAAQRRRGRCCGSASTGGAPSVVIARGAARALAARVAPARSTPHSRQDDDADVDGLRHVRRAGVLPLRAAHERGECGGGRGERPAWPQPDGAARARLACARRLRARGGRDAPFRPAVGRRATAWSACACRSRACAAGAARSEPGARVRARAVGRAPRAESFAPFSGARREATSSGARVKRVRRS